MPAPHRTLVLCFDGTWNNLQSNTNVSRLYSTVADASNGCVRQQKFYDAGVGTNWYDRIRGGAFGFGLDANIRLGYGWLALNYESGLPDVLLKVAAADPPEGGVTVSTVTAPVDLRKPNGDLLTTPPHTSGQEFLVGSDIYLFGFSRGAYTARSLGGLISYLGIPRIDPSKAVPKGKTQPLDEHPRIKEAWALYVERPTQADREQIASGHANAALKKKVADHDRQVEAFRADAQNRFPVRIHFIGVWDTVGALGVPKIGWIPASTKYAFHDTDLSQCVRHAYHAMAIDENRSEYRATLWTDKTDQTEWVQQRWFPGAHADVGGGYPDDLLHARPLLWLAQCAAERGLEFVDDRDMRAADGTPLKTCAAAPAAFELTGSEFLSPVHDSYGEFMGGAYKVIQMIPGNPGRYYRRMMVRADGVGQEIDESAFQKWKADPEYRPINLGQAGRQDVIVGTAAAVTPVAGVALGVAK